MKKILSLIIITSITFFAIVPASSGEKLFVNETENNKVDNIQSCEDKIIINSTETITIHTKNGPVNVRARIDTGADYSSMDIHLAKELGLTEHIGKINVTSANGTQTRPLVKISFMIAGKKKTSNFTLTDRSMLSYPILIGRFDLRGFLINP